MGNKMGNGMDNEMQNGNGIGNETGNTMGNEMQNGQPQGIAPTDIPMEKSKTVRDMVGAFQSIVTVEYIRGVKQNNWKPFNGKIWQRNYYEHIIRTENDYHRIAQYIINNPKNWDNDKLR